MHKKFNIMKTINKTDIKKLEKSYRLENGKFGSIPIAGKNDCYFLDVERETGKAVYFQFLGKMFWLPKSAFTLSSSFEEIDYFVIKSFFYSKMLSKF